MLECRRREEKTSFFSPSEQNERMKVVKKGERERERKKAPSLFYEEKKLRSEVRSNEICLYAVKCLDK